MLTRKTSSKGRRPSSGSRTCKAAAAPATRPPSPPVLRTPSPPALEPEPLTPQSKGKRTLLASTPKGDIYDNPPAGDLTPAGSAKGQNSDDEEDEDDPANAPEPDDEEEEESTRAPTYRTKEEETKRMAAADNLVLVLNEKKMAKQRELQALAQLAVLGYCAFPLAKPSPSINWGKYNPRDINPAKSALLRANMDTGLNNCDPQTVIKIGMRKGWFEGEFVNDIWGMSVLDLPQWKLTLAGMKAMKEGKIIPFSGNHHRHALIGYKETVQN